MDLFNKKKLEDTENIENSVDENMYGEFEKKEEPPVENAASNTVSNNTTANTASTNTQPESTNGINNQPYAYQEKEYKSGFLEEHTTRTTSSKVSRIFLLFFYVLAAVVIVGVIYLLRSDKYAFYLKKDEVMISKGSSYQIELLPKDQRYFDYLNYNYEIADESIAKVDKFGTVTAVGTGTTTLKISLRSGFGSKTMKINAQNIDVSSVQLLADIAGKIEEKSRLDIYVDETVTLQAAANNDHELNISVQYDSSDSSVAIVDEFGNVTGCGVGEATITGTTNGVSGSVLVVVKAKPSKGGSSSNPTPEPTSKPEPTFKPDPTSEPEPTNTPAPGEPTPKVTPTPKPATPVVTAKPTTAAKVHVKSVDIGFTKTTKYVGDTLQLYAKTTPADASDYREIWSSSKNDVATVTSSGLVVAKKAGTTYITVEVDGKTSKGQLIVKDRPSGAPTPTPKLATAKPATPAPAVTPTPGAAAPSGQQFSASEIQLSVTTLTINKNGTGTFNIKVSKAAGLVKVGSSNANVAKISVDNDLLTSDPPTCKKSGNDLVCFFDGVSKADTITYTVTGAGSGTATINVTLDDLGKVDGGAVSGSGKVGVKVN